MIGLDTNVLVRYLTQDEPAQAAIANDLIENRLSADTPGFIAAIVLVELVWVLESAYGCDRAAISAILSRILRAKPLRVENAEVAWQAARAFSDGRGDFADCMIERVANANGCAATLTFDKIATKHAGMRLLERTNG